LHSIISPYTKNFVNGIRELGFNCILTKPVHDDLHKGPARLRGRSTPMHAADCARKPWPSLLALERDAWHRSAIVQGQKDDHLVRENEKDKNDVTTFESFV